MGTFGLVSLSLFVLTLSLPTEGGLGKFFRKSKSKKNEVDAATLYQQEARRAIPHIKYSYEGPPLGPETLYPFSAAHPRPVKLPQITGGSLGYDTQELIQQYNSGWPHETGEWARGWGGYPDTQSRLGFHHLFNAFKPPRKNFASRTVLRHRQKGSGYDISPPKVKVLIAPSSSSSGSSSGVHHGHGTPSVDHGRYHPPPPPYRPEPHPSGTGGGIEPAPSTADARSSRSPPMDNSDLDLVSRSPAMDNSDLDLVSRFSPVGPLTPFARSLDEPQQSYPFDDPANRPSTALKELEREIVEEEEGRGEIEEVRGDASHHVIRKTGAAGFEPRLASTSNLRAWKR